MTNHKKLKREYCIATRDTQDVTIYADNENDFPKTVEDVAERVSSGEEGVDFTYGDTGYNSMFSFDGDEGGSAVYDRDAGDFLPHRKGCTPYAVVVSHGGVTENGIDVYPDFSTALIYARKTIADMGYDPGHYPDGRDKTFSYAEDDTYCTEGGFEVAVKNARVFPQC